MLSFMIPTEEKGFNLNTVPSPNEANATSATSAGAATDYIPATNRHTEQVIKTDLTSVAAASCPLPPPLPPPPVAAARGSPNNNSVHAAPVAKTSPRLNSMGASRELPLAAPLLAPVASSSSYSGSSLLEESYSEDTPYSESTLLLRAVADDDIMTPSTENTHDALTPSTENTRSSPCGGEDRPLLPHQTAVSGKTGKLKRVSFGSSKGSMVETVVYDYEPVGPVREEVHESPDPRATARHPGFATSTPVSTPARSEPSAAELAASRVRVTYFESKRPLVVPALEEAEVASAEELNAPPPPPPPPPPGHTQVTAAAGEMPTTYIVQTIDAGWENPFRPGGELSKEADQIVRAIQSGRPLDSSLDESDSAAAAAAAEPAHNGGPPVSEPLIQATVQTSVAAAPPPPAAAVHNGDSLPAAPAAAHRNGGSAAAPGAAGARAPQTALAAQPPGTVEVQHTLVKPEDASQVEQVTLKKKPRGKCCAVQ